MSSDGVGERYLAIVALYLCVKEASLLIDGNEYGDVPGDPVARADCPMEPRDLRKLRDRLGRFRHEILHLSDKSEEGRSLNMTWTVERPYWTFRSSVGRETLGYDEISQVEINNLLDSMDLWLRPHWERLVHEDDSPEKAAALAVKIDSVMGALSAGEPE
jgi:hypothetical protein